jgi:hypothetical protein
MRAGYAFKTVEPIISPSLGYSFDNFSFNPEMVIHWKNTEPVDFGWKLSYQFKFIEFGAGPYYSIYSLDKNNKLEENRNHWYPLYFISAHYDGYFIELDYLNQPTISIGAKTIIF